MEAIRQDKPVEIESLVLRGATLLPHYYSVRLDLPPEATVPRSGRYFTTKGPQPHLVNPVDWAALEHHFDAAAQLLHLGDGKIVFSRDERQSYLVKLDMAKQTRRAVHVAAKHGKLVLLGMLLQRGADPGQKNGRGESALFVAVRDGKEESAQILVEHGAWQCEEQKREVLKRACARSMACVLLVAGVAAGEAGPVIPNGPPPFDHMVQDLSLLPTPDEKQFRIDRIVEHGLSPDISTRCPTPASLRASASPTGCCLAAMRPVSPCAPQGPTTTRSELREWDASLRKALRGAVQKGDCPQIRALVQRGAPLDAIFDLGYGDQGNSIDWACVSGHPGAAVALLQVADEVCFGAELAKASRSALKWSVLNGWPEVIRELLRRGAYAGPSGGDSPMALAIRSWRGEEAAELLRHGAWQLESEEQRQELLARVRSGLLVGKVAVKSEEDGLLKESSQTVASALDPLLQAFQEVGVDLE